MVRTNPRRASLVGRETDRRLARDDRGNDGGPSGGGGEDGEDESPKRDGTESAV